MADTPTATNDSWPPPAGSVLLTLGDIAVTDSEVLTPNGTYPLRRSNWIVTHQWTTTTRIPPVAIVLAIVFAIFCLIGLLFLLMKEKVTTGFVQVSVSGDGFYYATQLPVSNEAQIPAIDANVNYVRSLVARLG